jgi:hypothetical protein
MDHPVWPVSPARPDSYRAQPRNQPSQTQTHGPTVAGHAAHQDANPVPMVNEVLSLRIIQTL